MPSPRIGFFFLITRDRSIVQMLFDEQPMEQEQVYQEEVWPAIRYLDPDERDEDREGKSAKIIAPLALLVYGVCAVWVVLWQRAQKL